jgi:hypothetical protein
MIRLATLLVAVLMPHAALADAGSDFIAKLAGRWSGAGTIRVSATDAPAATSCRLNASGGAASLQISGACDGAARGANLSVSLTWVAATQQFTGRLRGTTLVLNVTSSSGGRSTMTVALRGNTAARLSLSGRDRSGKAVQYVSLPLRKG